MSWAEAQAGIVLVLPFTRVGSVSLILLKNNPATVSRSAFWSLSHYEVCLYQEEENALSDREKNC